MADNRSAVLMVLREILGDVVLSDATTAKDVAGWDSLKQVMILTEVESRFGFQFTSREMDELRSVGDLIRLIDAKASR